MFCFHKWKVSSTKFTPPYHGSFEFKGEGAVEASRKTALGFTTVIMRCERCGTPKITEHAGDITAEVALLEYEKQFK